MKTMLIAGNPLEPKCHNVGSNAKREGLKSFRIGQSAAKSINFFEGTNLQPIILAGFLVFLSVGSSSAGSDKVFKMQAKTSLFPFALEVRENGSNKLSGNTIAPRNSICGSTGFEDAAISGFASEISDIINSDFIAHHYLSNGAVLASDGTASGIELLDSKAPLAIHDPSYVGDISLLHASSLKDDVNVQRLSPRGVESSDSKCMVPSAYKQNEGSDIVFSSSKDEAALKAVSASRTETKIKPYMGDDYMGISWPSTWRPMKNDLEGVYQYRDEGFQMIYNGEIGKYEGCRFIEQTNIAKASWTNQKSNWAFFFGEDTAAEALVIPEEMRGKIPSDYGRSKGIAWYYLGGFALTQTQALQARILKWDSAA